MNNWTLTNKQYDILKWFVSIFIPALITFLGTVMTSLGWAHTELFLTIAVAFQLFLGTVFKLSDSNYKKNEEEL